MKVRNIEVGIRIGESSQFRIYTGKTDDSKQVILKVAKTFEDGEVLKREAKEFNILKTCEAEISGYESDKGKNSHYDWLFGNLTASFMEPTQGDRRINVFEIPDVDLSQLVPLSKLCAETEIDARTSVWMFGRFLKFYSLFKLIAISEDESAARYPIFSPDDYLIGPERHRVIYYNFSEDVADVMATDFVKAIANFMLGWVVISEDSAEQEYYKLLKDFAELGRDSFEEAHGELYALVKRLWGLHYYPFTYRDRGTTYWKKKNKEE